MAKPSTFLLVTVMFAASAAMASVAQAANPTTAAGKVGELRVWDDPGGVYVSLIDVAYTNPTPCPSSSTNEYHLNAAANTLWNALLAAKLSGHPVSLVIWNGGCSQRGYPAIVGVNLH